MGFKPGDRVPIMRLGEQGEVVDVLFIRTQKQGEWATKNFIENASKLASKRMLPTLGPKNKDVQSKTFSTAPHPVWRIVATQMLTSSKSKWVKQRKNAELEARKKAFAKMGVK